MICLSQITRLKNEFSDNVRLLDRSTLIKKNPGACLNVKILNLVIRFRIHSLASIQAGKIVIQVCPVGKGHDHVS